MVRTLTVLSLSLLALCACDQKWCCVATGRLAVAAVGEGVEVDRVVP